MRKSIPQLQCHGAVQEPKHHAEGNYQNPSDVRGEGCLHDGQDLLPNPLKGPAAPSQLNPAEQHEQRKHDGNVLEGKIAHGHIDHDKQHGDGGPIVRVLDLREIPSPPVLQVANEAAHLEKLIKQFQVGQDCQEAPSNSISPQRPRGRDHLDHKAANDDHLVEHVGPIVIPGHMIPGILDYGLSSRLHNDIVICGEREDVHHVWIHNTRKFQLSHFYWDQFCHKLLGSLL
mmetsp:Transcript_22200/g.52822  ORF Transcript_22200/g.52822 Transcript_22200/m.52822 type:complete len:230 (+) Transcript_22200:853-1542(+)